jgi:hypothetical protein
MTNLLAYSSNSLVMKKIGALFTKFHFIRNLRMSPKGKSVTLKLPERPTNDKPYNILVQFIRYEENWGLIQKLNFICYLRMSPIS